METGATAGADGREASTEGESGPSADFSRSLMRSFTNWLSARFVMSVNCAITFCVFYPP